MKNKLFSFVRQAIRNCIERVITHTAVPSFEQPRSQRRARRPLDQEFAPAVRVLYSSDYRGPREVTVGAVGCRFSGALNRTRRIPSQTGRAHGNDNSTQSP